MGPDVLVGIGRHVDRTEVVEEQERPDGLPHGRGQQAAHDETTPRSSGCGGRRMRLGKTGLMRSASSAGA